MKVAGRVIGRPMSFEEGLHLLFISPPRAQASRRCENTSSPCQKDGAFSARGIHASRCPSASARPAVAALCRRLWSTPPSRLLLRNTIRRRGAIHGATAQRREKEQRLFVTGGQLEIGFRLIQPRRRSDTTCPGRRLSDRLQLTLITIKKTVSCSPRIKRLKCA